MSTTQTVSIKFVVGFFLDHAQNLFLESAIRCITDNLLVGRHSSPKPDIVSLGFHYRNDDVRWTLKNGWKIHGEVDLDDTYYVVNTHSINAEYVIFKVTNDGALHEFRRTRDGDYRYTCSLNHEWAGKRLEWIARDCVDEEAYNLVIGAPRPSIAL